MKVYIPGVYPLGVELAEYPPGVGPLYKWLGPGYRNSKEIQDFFIMGNFGHVVVVFVVNIQKSRLILVNMESVWS